MYYKGI